MSSSEYVGACRHCGKRVTWLYPSTKKNYCNRTCAALYRYRVSHRNPSFGDTASIRKDGYVQIAVDGEVYLEHRIIMMGLLGRPLGFNDNVHHENGHKFDNRPENLELLSRADHASHHARPKNLDLYDRAACAWCGADVLRYRCANRWKKPGWNTFCNQQCFGKHKSRTMKGKRPRFVSQPR